MLWLEVEVQIAFLFYLFYFFQNFIQDDIVLNF